jgi:flagella basal body P-ring formation protein FlgA
MMNIIKQKMILLLLLLACSLGLQAANKQSLQDIEQAAYIHVLSDAQMNFDNAQVALVPLDSRLNLAACDSELKAFSKKSDLKMGKQTIGVKCFAPVAWTVYVQADIKVYKKAVVAAKPLSAGQVISAADIKLANINISGLRKSFSQKTKQVIGQQLKYSIAMGDIISPSSLKAKKVVARGQVITLVAKAGTMEVRMSGQALASAALGQRVKVKNLSSKRVVEGIVDAPGVVMVTM